MVPNIKKIGLAISFSPNSQAHLKLASALCKRWGASLTLIYVGEPTEIITSKLDEIIKQNAEENISVRIVAKTGEPSQVILNTISTEQIDLLLAGALEREDLRGYYIGSVARKLMRKCSCSLLILTPDFITKMAFSKIFFTTEFSEKNELALHYAADLAKMFGGTLGLIREFQVPGLAITVNATGSLSETEGALEIWKAEEETKMDIYIREHNFSGLVVTKKCIYGKEGFESSSYAKQENADLLVFNALSRKLSILDRIFQHDAEYILKELPCSVLMVRP